VTVFKSISTWLLDLDSGAVRQFTPWRNGLSEFPASFSPDGTSLALSSRLDRAGRPPRFAALAVRLDGSGSTLLARGVAEPIYSPDGASVALITTGKTKTFESEGGTTTYRFTDLAVANSDGSGLR
jgi:Tol biopolymer transport system component